MARIQETPKQDAIAKYLQEHPLSSAKDVREGLGSASSTVGVRLLKMYEAGIVTREQDEEHVYRYVLKNEPQPIPIDAEDDLDIKVPTEEEKGCSRALEYARSYAHARKMTKDVWSYVGDHPDTSAQEIASALNVDFYDVGGFLLFAWQSGEYAYKRTQDDKGVWRYSWDEERLKAPKKKEAKEKTLDDFTPREMFEHLKKLGYKWNPQALWHEKVTVERNFVEFDKI